MTEQLNNNDEVMIQLPWTVPPQPLYIPYIEIDPEAKKIPLDLNVSSTDTTAIAAFDYATVVAVFLALCATGLAYWFGARSFVLTKQSFDAVVKQIKSSEDLMAISNRELIESQKELKKEELTDLHNREILKEVILFEKCIFSINVYLKRRSDKQPETADERVKLKDNLNVFLAQRFNLNALIKAYKDLDLSDNFRSLDIKYNELIDKVINHGETGFDTEISNLINSSNDICKLIYAEIRKAA